MNHDSSFINKISYLCTKIAMVRIAAIKREWGVNPRLSRSCKFHYVP